MKKHLLGSSFGSAAGKLRKAVMFDLVKRLGENTCFRCRKRIESADEFSLDHKTAWRQSIDPVHTFFDLSNIAFSHHSCNSAAKHHPSQKYKDAAERKRVQSQRYRKSESWARTVAKRREKRRLARLVPTAGNDPA